MTGIEESSGPDKSVALVWARRKNDFAAYGIKADKID